MNEHREHKCKGCLIDSTHGKLQKKKDALLEFIFAGDSLCLTVSAQNVNIMAYTLSKETMLSIIHNNDLLVINFKAKKQIKISAIGLNKLYYLKNILDSLLHEDFDAYQKNIEHFCNNSNQISKTNQSTNSSHNDSSLLSDVTSKKPLKTDKMKHVNHNSENDENSLPTALNLSKTNEKKKNALNSASNFYPNSRHDHHLSIDENTDHIIHTPQQSRKRTSENTSSTSTIRFDHATNRSSHYFFHKTDNKLKRNFSNGESRISPLSNIYSKPLNNNTRLWDDDDINNDYAYDWRTSPYSTKKNDNETSTDISLSKAVSTTMNLRKKGLKNIGATCYMNAILQCLLNIDPFRYDLMVTNSELITSSLLEENTIYLSVLQILALLQDRQSVQSQNSTTTQLSEDERMVESQALINLKKAVEKHSGNFLGSRQQDSHEFLNLVISLITDEIDAIKIKINDQSLLFKHEIIDPTTNNFQFCLATERCCEICGMSTIKTEIHTALLIHVTDEESKTTKTNSLTDLLENYFASEIMDGCFCDDCQSNQRKYIKYSLERLPRIFIFYLKRWHITKNSNGELQSVSKEDHPIDCSIEIDVYPFCSSNTLQPCLINTLEELPNLKDLLKQREQIFNIIEPKRARIEQIDSGKTELYEEEENIIATHGNYRLFAVINHHGGSSDVGHYTSTVYDAKGNTWWTYDDTSVTSCTEQRVLKNLAPDAYGVMYMHKDILKLFQPVINNITQ